MELPIQIIVVMFVALAVGGAVIMFSQTTLNRAQTDFADRWRNDPAMKDSIVEVNEATSGTIISLAKECYKKMSATPDGGVCFALFATTWTADFAAIDGTPIGGTEETQYLLDTSAVVEPVTAVRISYDPLGAIRVTN